MLFAIPNPYRTDLTRHIPPDDETLVAPLPTVEFRKHPPPPSSGFKEVF